MAKGDVVVKANRVRNWQKLGKYIKLSLLILLLLLIVIYLVLKVLFSDGSFSVSIDSDEMLYSGLAMYETRNDPTPKRRLKAENIQFMDNISIKWLPSNIDTEAEGSHNGDNYIAYTFFIENQGDQSFNYWYNINMGDVIKDADEAARIMIFLNGEKTIYAKASPLGGEAEEGTTKFRDDEDGTIILEKREQLQPGEVDRITIVVWIEGDDPECVDALIGGQMRLDMKITEEHVSDSVQKEESANEQEK